MTKESEIVTEIVNIVIFICTILLIFAGMKNELTLRQSLILLHAGWAKDDERWNYGPICSSFMRIYWVTKGCASVTMNGKEYTLSEGHFYLIPPYVTHITHSNGVFEHYYLHLADRSRTFENVFEQYTLPFEVPANQDCTRIFTYLVNKYPELKLAQPSPNTYETNSNLLAAEQRYMNYPIGLRCQITGMAFLLYSLFLCEAVRRTHVTDNRITHALWFIDNNMHRPITTSELAGIESLGKEQFIRIFSKQMGATPTTYIISRKIYRAQTLLIEQKISIKEVATMLGYDNFSYFCRLFRQHVGMSPRQFIRQNS